MFVGQGLMSQHQNPYMGDVALPLDVGLRLPDHVVYRSFVSETVMLNLETAQYHGLNSTAAHMITRLDGAASVRAAIEQIAIDYGREPDDVQPDVVALVMDLLARGLLLRSDA